MKKRLLAALLFLSCCMHAKPVKTPPRVHCTTPCGMRAELGSTQECENLVTAESATLDAFKKRVRWFDRQAACLSLRDLSVIRHRYVPRDDQCNWISWEAEGLCVVGFSRIERREIEVLPLLPWEKSSLPHEMAHAVFGLAHCGWKERGIKRALKDVDGEWDTSPDECMPKPRKRKKK